MLSSSSSFIVRHKPLMGLMIVSVLLLSFLLFTGPSSYALPVNPDGTDWNVDQLPTTRFLFEDWVGWFWHVRFPVEGDTFKDVDISDQIGFTYNGVTNRVSHASGGSSVYSLINPALTDGETNYTTELTYDFYGRFFLDDTGDRFLELDDNQGIEISFDVQRNSGFRYNYLSAYLITQISGNQSVGYQYIDSFWDFSPGSTQHIAFTYGGPGYTGSSGGFREYVLGIRLVFGTSNQSNVSKGLGFTIANWNGVFFYGGIVIPDGTDEQLDYIINGKVYHNPPPTIPSSETDTLDQYHQFESGLIGDGSSTFTELLQSGRSVLRNFSVPLLALGQIFGAFFNRFPLIQSVIHVLLCLGLVATFFAIVPTLISRFNSYRWHFRR